MTVKRSMNIQATSWQHAVHIIWTFQVWFRDLVYLATEYANRDLLAQATWCWFARLAVVIRIQELYLWRVGVWQMVLCMILTRKKANIRWTGIDNANCLAPPAGSRSPTTLGRFRLLLMYWCSPPGPIPVEDFMHHEIGITATGNCVRFNDL